MGDRYLFEQCSVVDHIQLPGKAVLTFTLHDETQRALLWVKGFVNQGRNLEPSDSFQGKLSIGDTVYFDGHIYDRESKDHCQWYAAKAWRESENQAATPRLVTSLTGHIFELDIGKGVIVFDLNEVEQRVFFMRSKFFNFGRRPGNKHNLNEFLSENDPVQFDAQQCEANKENKNCSWFASLVWKGKKPVQGSVQNWATGNTRNADDVTSEDSASNAGRDIDDENEFPSLALPPGLTERHGYKAFEANSSIREGHGNILSLINEECGIALWMVHQNTWETVFFHRKNSFLVDVNLSKYDLHESFAAGTALEIQAVPAIQDFPCRWIAQRAVATC